MLSCCCQPVCTHSGSVVVSVAVTLKLRCYPFAWHCTSHFQGPCCLPWKSSTFHDSTVEHKRREGTEAFLSKMVTFARIHRGPVFASFNRKGFYYGKVIFLSILLFIEFKVECNKNGKCLSADFLFFVSLALVDQVLKLK